MENGITHISVFWTFRPSHLLSFCRFLFHIACAALRAMVSRWSLVSLAARAVPPSLPRATAAGFLAAFIQFLAKIECFEGIFAVPIHDEAGTCGFCFVLYDRPAN